LPGMISFAITPTINPIIIAVKRPNILPPVNGQISCDVISKRNAWSQTMDLGLNGLSFCLTLGLELT
jgi:hypothetical protein